MDDWLQPAGIFRSAFASDSTFLHISAYEGIVAGVENSFVDIVAPVGDTRHGLDSPLTEVPKGPPTPNGQGYGIAS